MPRLLHARVRALVVASLTALPITLPPDAAAQLLGPRGGPPTGTLLPVRERAVPAHRGTGRSAALRAEVAGAGVDTVLLREAYVRAATLPRLRSLLVQSRGRLVGERYYRGATRATRANIKSASKSIVSALVGIAIARGALRGVDQTVAELLPAYVDGRADPRKRAITVEDLLTMRSGLESTSFENYGRWVSSRNWVRSALDRPVVAERGGAGGPMIYSTGSTHLLSAILTRATGMSTYHFARRFLAEPLGIALRPWQADPQGIYFGGNEMYLTPRDMLKLGALYLNGGAANGRQIVPREWIERSTQAYTRSGWSDNDYGYGWWIRTVRGHKVYYAWGYGGQFVFVVPDLELVVVTTSAADAATREHGHLEAIYALLEEYIVPAAGE
jgi:CubicO group peptidase (beta-lactamase class C family)